jgi:Protein of unknown function (DUF3307)
VIGWGEAFVALLASHLTGDFLLQTQWQALNKHGGLSRRPTARRALVMHVLTYTAAFVPAFIWIGNNVGAGVLAIIALVAIPHLIQDDGRVVTSYLRVVKHTVTAPGDAIFMLVDQSLHLVTLFGVAVLAHAMS